MTLKKHSWAGESIAQRVWRQEWFPSSYTASLQAFLGQCISVTYPRRTAGRRLDNLGVRMREHFCIFEKLTRSTEIIYK